MPGKFDSKGSGAITDQVDQVLTVWRNKEKQKTIEQFTFDKKLPTPEIENKPDAILACDKNRHGEWEGGIGLWYHAASLQYTADNRVIPIEFMNL